MIRAARAAFVLAAALAAFAPPASTAPLPSTQGDIDSLPPVLQGAISATLGERDPAYRLEAEDTGLRARNARHALAASLGAGGMAISAGGGEWRMRLAGWQRGAGRQPAAAVATRVNRNRVEVERGGVTEWWVNGPAGLQQGWTVAARPFPEERGALTLVMAQSGSLLAKAAGDRSLDITDGAGRGVLRYGGLTAFDATGRELPASFEVAAGEVRVRVDDAAAVYPVLIDPIAQHAYLKASNTGMGDGFGLSVAIAGDTVVVGAFRESSGATGVNGNQADNGAPESGAAYVFVRSGSAWSQQAYLKASNTQAGDYFGWSVAISGDTLVVGAPREDSGATGVGGNEADNAVSNAGAAYVFVRSGSTWSQQAYLKASNTDAGDEFGYSVAISGDTIVVGAWEERSRATGINGNQADNGATSPGAAYVFVRGGTAWSQQAYLKASNTEGFDQFGWSVAVSGDTIVVGAPQEGSSATGVDGNQADNSALNAGAAYVFFRSGTTWSQQAYLKASNTGGGDRFGWSVAISADTLVVGASQESSSATGVNGNQADNSASNAGAAYVFVRSGSTWSQQAYLKASNAGPGDFFGHAVAISGDTVVVGARFEASGATSVDGNQADNTAANAGAAYVFTRSGAAWAQQAYLKASNAGAGDLFGTAVSISGDTVVVGAPDERSNATGVDGNGADDSAPASGAAYVFGTAFTVTPGAGAGGAISPATPQAVASGGTATFTVTPDPGYAAVVAGTCGGALVGNTYTTNPVTADCTVTATFTTAAASLCFATRDDGANVFSSADASALQAVASAAAAGDTIKVAGTCTGVQSLGGTTQAVRTGVPLTIAGGYAPSIAPAGWTATPDRVANPTILDAATGGRVVYATAALALRDLTVRNGRSTILNENGGGIFAATDLTLQGVTVQGNQVTNSSGSTGGGGVHSAGGTLAITNSVLRQNSSSSFGGGFLAFGALVMTDSQVVDNTSANSAGGGLAVGAATITGSLFSGNAAGGGSGALYAISGGDISRSRFVDNRGNGGGGGAIYIESGAATIADSLFSRNQSSSPGTALNIVTPGAVTVTRTTIRDGVAGPVLSAIDAGGNGAVTVTNSIVADAEEGIHTRGTTIVTQNHNLFSGNGADMVGAAGTFVGGTGTLTGLDPLFVSPGTDDLRLQLASPAIDAGDPAFASAGTDLAGNPRVFNARVDIGAYETARFTVTPTAGANGAIAPAVPQHVAPNGTVAFTVTPDPGYAATVGGTCGGTLVGTTYTTIPVTANCTVAASFTLNNYTVTPGAGPNGTISPATPQAIAHGGTATFTVTPDAGYTASVGGTCGGSLVGNTYTTNPITAACTVVATFTQNTYTVTPSAGPNGTISPATPQAVAYGGTLAFTVTPSVGYAPVVGGTCGGTLAGNTYTTNPVTANCTVAATFTASPVNTYTGPSATGSGTITASFTGGGPACSYTVSRFIPLTGDPASPPAGTAPAGTTFPHGLFDFTASACAPGSTLTMTITYPQALQNGTQYWKYGPTPTNPVPHWYVLPATIAGNTATFTITDGQLGDDDLAANGTIVDQGGPGTPASAVAVPTLSQWAMLLLAGLVMLAGMGAVRARRG